MSRPAEIQSRSETHLRAHRDAIAQLIRGESLETALTTIISAIEASVPGSVGAIVLVDENEECILPGVAPRLPDRYSRDVDGVRIGPAVASCGTAIYRRERVVVTDTQTDPLWADYRDFARAYDIRACWSQPVFSGAGKVIGSFALHFPTCREPNTEELTMLADFGEAAAVVIEHAQIRSSLDRAISLADATIESTDDGILVVDNGYVIRKFNQRFAKMWNIPEGVLAPGKSVHAVAFVLDQLKYPEQTVARIREIHANPDDVNFDLLEFKDGRVFERYSRPQWLDGKAVGRVWSFRDVTKRHASERALRESEARFRTLSDGSYEAVVIHDNGKILLHNRAGAEMFGYYDEELVGRHITEFLMPDSAIETMKHTRSEYTGVYESIGIRKDGSTFNIEANGRPVEFEGRKVRMACLRDITERKTLQKQLERNLDAEHRARIAAENAMRLRDDFLAIASHELKTPLTPLKMYLQILRGYLDEMELPDSPKTRLLREAVDHTDREYDRLFRLINELLDVSRISGGVMDLKPERFDLSELVRDTAGRFAREFERAGCPVTLDVADGIVGHWDRSAIERVVTNLITNALKFGAGRPVAITARLEAGRAVLTVRDQGIGVPHEEHERIFQRFVRAAPIKNYAGLGLGLYIAREIVEAHGGTIRVESEPGQGATFVVSLPVISPA